MKKVIEYQLFENLQKAKKLLADNKIPETHPDFIKLRTMLSNNTGYMGQFTKWLFIDRTEFSQLDMIFKELLKINIDKPIEEFEKAEELFDYITKFEINRKTNQVINAIPSKARELATPKLKQLIALNIDVAASIKDFYSKKGGKFKNSKDLYDDTQALIQNLKGDFNLETIKVKASKLNTDIIYETPELLILQVNDFKASNEMGSKSWCISTQQSYWNSYVNEFTNQYFIYDFTKSISDKRHLIGTTISPSGSFHAAHFADDSRVSDYSIFDDM
jgi:hypothetical protein